MANTGKEFESYVEFVYRTMLNLRDEGIRVSRSMDVKDTRGRLYNIDVYYEFVQAGVTHRVAIECKDTARPIDRDEVLAFDRKLQALPSTIGVVISRNGFQRATKEFLEDAGILHLTGDELPKINQLLADRILAVALPDDGAVGQPFWTFMEVRGGKSTGTYYAEPNPRGEGGPQVVLLFFSRKHAEFFFASRQLGSNWAIRGLPQHVLRTAMLIVHAMGGEFLCVYNLPTEENRAWPVRAYSPKALAAEYYPGDIDKWVEPRC